MCSFFSAAFVFHSWVVIKTRIHLGASPVSQYTVTNQSEFRTCWATTENSLNRASKTTTQCSKAVETKATTHQDSFSWRTKAGGTDGKMCPGYRKEDNWTYAFPIRTNPIWRQRSLKKGRALHESFYKNVREEKKGPGTLCTWWPGAQRNEKLEFTWWVFPTTVTLP